MAGEDEFFLGTVRALSHGVLGVGELIGVAGQLAAAGRGDLAGQVYRLWIGLNPTSPMLYAICFNLGVLMAASGDAEEAKRAYQQAIATNADFIEAYINLGTVLESQGDVDQAISVWQMASDRLPQVTGPAVRLKTMVLRQLGRARSGPDAEICLRQILELDPREGDVAEHYLANRLSRCQWPVLDAPEGVTMGSLLSSLHPLSAAVFVDHPLFHLALNWHHNRRQVGYGVSILDPKPVSVQVHRRLRVGYLSSDLCAHAVGYLIVEAMERHDHAKVEVFVYYCGPQTGDWINTRIRAVTDCWIDINGMDDEAAARRIQSDDIDILVDLNGNTKGSRTRICAMRPAPVVVNWLGFPGTMGSPYHHYIIADEWIIPPEHEIYYSEKVLRLHCYQPNDRKRMISAQQPSRADVGLPEEAMVYCCFNFTQKISRKVFEMWMTVLNQVPHSVLWLLSTSDELNQYIRQLAGGYGIEGERLHFAPWVSSPDHLARYPLADLFLDTYPYGAHTTASDALWMSVPMLTLSGRSFASRVCGSLVRSAGLPELVCATPGDFIEKAVELGHQRERLLAYREKLSAARESCVMFNTDLLVRRLESLYTEMWEDYQSGRLPRPDLANLEVYLEMAVGDNLDEYDLSAIAEYDQWFREKLVRRDKVCPLLPDSRLWR